MKVMVVNIGVEIFITSLERHQIQTQKDNYRLLKPPPDGCLSLDTPHISIRIFVIDSDIRNKL